MTKTLSIVVLAPTPAAPTRSGRSELGDDAKLVVANARPAEREIGATALSIATAGSNTYAGSEAYSTELTTEPEIPGIATEPENAALAAERRIVVNTQAADFSAEPTQA